MSTLHCVRRRWGVFALWIGLVATTTARAAEPSPADLEFFEKRVRPLLVEHCQKCHGSAKQESGLRLDRRDGVERGGEGGPIIDRKALESSRLLEVIGYEGDIQMPPKGRLPDDQIATLTEWVKRGAPWPAGNADSKTGEFDLAARKAQQWALQPVQPQTPPDVRHPEWVSNEIDQFVVARLEAAGLAPSPVVNKRSLLRRLTYDLVGLPPTLEELEAFEADNSPQAVETVIDRLLASPRYGERWARHWLDLVRYAETSGHEFDFEIPLAWQYRDYVVRGLNADVPYNQWVLEHVAGDLLTEPRRHPVEGFNESIIGTGFWYLGESKHSPVDIRVDAAERLDNQIDVFSKTFLAQTVACARCHDHKFDAISTADYHALAGFIQSSRQQLAWIDNPQLRAEPIARLTKLAEERSRGASEAAREGWQTARPELRKLLLAAVQVLRPGEASKAPPASQPRERPTEKLEVVFEDFERETYAPWVAMGTAFEGGPNRLPLPDYQGDVNAVGQGLVNSHSVRPPGEPRRSGDQFTGTLKSPEFEILAARPFIHFLVGGGAHVGKTCVNLIVADQVVRSTTGKNNNRMEWATWDVSDLAGRQARIEIVDNEAGGWGNIGCDQVVFSRSPVPGEMGKRLLEVAQSQGLALERLGAVVQWLTSAARRDPDHPLGLLARWAQRPGAGSPAEWTQFMKETAVNQPAEGEGATFERLSLSPGDWYPAGDAFAFLDGSGRDLPATGGLPFDTQTAVVPHSGWLSRRMQGALRSKSFVISKPQLWYRLLGQGARVRLVIDQFQQIRAPIYGGLEFGINSPGAWHWHAQDVSKWVGHAAYIEILDEGDGFAAIDGVVAADRGPPFALRGGWTGADCRSPEELVERLLGWGDRGADWLTRASSDDPGREAAPQDRRAGQWLLHELTATGPAAWPRPGQWAESLAQSNRQIAELEAPLAYHRRVLAMADGDARNEAIHPRGNPNRFGDVVPRRILESLQLGEATDYGPESGRLMLARQLTDPRNPLLARVLVNRVWKQHFSEGLAPTPDDFGNMGQAPAIPELLDWLTGEFQRRGWSLKQLHRLLLTSRTYALASTGADPRAAEVDPLNRLWHRGPLRRLEAETIRDAILAVSGRLNPAEGGPPVMPHLTPFMIGRGRPGQSGPLDGDGRRSVYLAVRRNFLNPMFQAFDAPVPFSTIGRRSVSNVPAQALSLLNNPFVLQQADLWAQRARGTAGTPAEAIRRMYLVAFTREPTAEELEQALEYVSSAPDAGRAWADLAHVLINVKEFVWIP